MRQYIYIAIAVIILGMAATISFQYKSIEAKNKEIAQLEIAIEGEKQVTEALRNKIDRAQHNILELSLKNKEHELEANTIKKELEEAKGRKKAVLGRPTLVEKLANKKTDKVFNQIECITGGECK